MAVPVNLEVDGLLKFHQSFTKRLLQSDDFLAREGGGRFRKILEVDGLLKLHQSFKKRLLQSDDFLAREDGGRFRSILHRS